MKNVVKVIIFLIYTITIFFIKSYEVLAFILFFQILLMIIMRISIKEAIRNIVTLLPFIVFTVVIDIWIMSVVEAILIGARLIMVCNVTYIFGKTITASEIAKSIEYLLFPLKWFRVNTKNIAIIVSIAITFIPIIKQEWENIKYALVAKGFDIRFFNKIRHIDYMLGPLFLSLLKRIDDIEYSLKAKGYIEE